MYYRLRIPKFGRDLAYYSPSCELLIATSSPEVYRFDLNEGKFRQTLVSNTSGGVNAVTINPAHGLWTLATDSGTVELYDPRSRALAGVLDVAAPSQENSLYGQWGGASDGASIAVTAVKCRDDGLTMAAGTSSGLVALYDLRSSHPLLIKDHQYDLPIKSIAFHEGTVLGSERGDGKCRVLSCDSHAIRIWDVEDVSGQDLKPDILLKLQLTFIFANRAKTLPV